MTKEEIKTKLLTTGLINRFKLDPTWVEAFLMYNEEKKAKLKPSCGSCFKKVKEWIMR